MISGHTLRTLRHCGHIHSALLLVYILMHAYSEVTIRVSVSHTMLYITELMFTILTAEITMPIYCCYKLPCMVISSMESTELILILPIQLFYIALICISYPWFPAVCSVVVLLLQLCVILIIFLPYRLKSCIQLCSMPACPVCVLKAAILYEVVVGIWILVLAQCLMSLLPIGLQLL